MNHPQHIDFISAYCDRWCERCSMTDRCSAFTANAAIAMCEDARDGLELAFGRAPDDDGVVKPLPKWVEDFVDVEMTPAESAAYERKEAQRREAIEDTALMQRSRSIMRLARQWLSANRERLAAHDALLTEALDVAGYDHTFVRMKLYRAMEGKCGHADGDDDDEDDDPVQNDWNGSAKVALISIVRSVEAWSVLASATGSDTAAMLSAQFADLRDDVEREFPDAWKFRRPGFDVR